MQLHFFESSSRPSSAPTSTSPPTIVGLRVRLPHACRCGGYIATIGSSSGPHEHRLDCERCGTWGRWLGRAEAAFIAEGSAEFGCPQEPLILRGGVGWRLPLNCSVAHSGCVHVCVGLHHGHHAARRRRCSSKCAVCLENTRSICR